MGVHGDIAEGGVPVDSGETEEVERRVFGGEDDSKSILDEVSAKDQGERE